MSCSWSDSMQTCPTLFGGARNIVLASNMLDRRIEPFRVKPKTMKLGFCLLR
jgi:hypothetical protein